MSYKPSVSSPAATRAPIGFVSPKTVEAIFVRFLYLVMLILVLLSILGTFYGIQQRVAPVLTPLRIWTDFIAGWNVLIVALVAQGALTLTQYGARAMAKDDPRWWALYLMALSISVYYNFQAYWTPLTALSTWHIAAGIIIAGDVLPEFLMVRRR